MSIHDNRMDTKCFNRHKQKAPINDFYFMFMDNKNVLFNKIWL